MSATRSSTTGSSPRTTSSAGTGRSPEKGWVAPHWPVEWGGTDWTVVQRYIFEEECGAAGCPPIVAFGVRMCAPVLLRFGTPAQKQRFLPRIYNGDDFWCQGYSEPGSGSDLASLKTRAVRQGDALRRHRPEDLDDPGPLRRLDLLPGAHRRHPREAPGGHLLPAHRHALAGHHRAAHRAHGRRPRGQRGLLRRGEGARREPRPRGAQGLDGGQVPARLRAHGHGQHRRVQARAGPGEGAGRAARPSTAGRSSTTRAFAIGSRGWRSS